MSDRKLPQLAKDLIAAKRLIENEEDWCPEEEGVPQGLKVKEDGRVARCALMACDAVSIMSGCVLALFDASRKMGYENPISVNTQGHAAVMRMFDLAIQGAINGE